MLEHWSVLFESIATLKAKRMTEILKLIMKVIAVIAK